MEGERERDTIEPFALLDKPLLASLAASARLFKMLWDGLGVEEEGGGGCSAHLRGAAK